MVDILKLRKMSETPKQASVAIEEVVEKTAEVKKPQQVEAPEPEGAKEPVKPLSKPQSKPEKVETPPVEESVEQPIVTSQTKSSDQDQKVVDLVVFTLAGRLFGVDIIKVQEVVRYTEITRVPNAAEFVLGVMNLRGNITPVIDLHKRFSLSEASWTDKTRIIVLQIKDQAIGFLVDHVSEIMHPLESDIEPTSTVHANIGTDYISGVVKVRDSNENANKLLILLNLEKIFDEGSIALA